MKYLLFLILTSLTIAQVDSMRVTWTESDDADLYGTIIYADTIALPTTVIDTVLAGTEELEWLPTYGGLWRVRAKSLDDSSNTSAYSSVDTVTIWRDSIPSQFTFYDSTGAAVSSQIITRSGVVLSGFDSAQVTVTGGDYRLSALATWTRSPSFASTGDTLWAVDTSSASALTKTDVIVTIASTTKDTFSVTTGSSYDFEAQAYFDAVTLSANRKDTINTFIEMLKDSLGVDTLSERMAGMGIFTNSDTVAALTNIIYPDTVARTRGGMTFVADGGFTGDSTAAGTIETNITPYYQSNISLNDMTMGVYIRTNVSQQVADMGFSNIDSPFTRFEVKSEGTEHGFSAFFGNEAEIRQFEEFGTSQGLRTVTRRGETDAETYKNGTSFATSATTTSGHSIPVKELIIGNNSLGTVSCTRQIGFWFLMDGVTDTELRGIFNCVEWYMDAIGKGVVP